MYNWYGDRVERREWCKLASPLGHRTQPWLSPASESSGPLRFQATRASTPDLDADCESCVAPAADSPNLSNVSFVAESLDTWSAGAKQHCPSTQQKSLQAAQWVTWHWQYCMQSRIDRVSDHCMRWCMHRAFRRWSFGCRTRTRLDSNSCFDNGFFFVFWVWTRHPRPISPLPTRSPPHKYAWQEPTSIVDLSAQEPCRFFSRKAGRLWTLNKQP